MKPIKATISGLIKSLSHRLTLNWILNNRWIPAGAILAITIALALCIPRLTFETSIYDLVIDDIPENQTYQSFKEIFGSEEIIRVVIHCENVFDSITFKQIEVLAQKAAKIPGVNRVISLPTIKKTIDLANEWSLAQFAEHIGNAALFQKNLISKNARTTVITLVLADQVDHRNIIASIDKLMGQADQNLSLYQIGMPLVSQALANYTAEDFRRLPPVTYLLIAGVLVLIFRRFTMVIPPLCCVALVLIWTFGIMGLFRQPLSLLTMIVPVFLIAVCTAYCLHIMAAFAGFARTAETSKAAVRKTFEQMSFPTALAVGTTIFGLSSLFVNRIEAIQAFAFSACVGMFSALIILLIFFPVLLSWLPLVPQTPPAKKKQTTLLTRFIDAIVAVNLKHQKIAFAILIIVVIALIPGILRLRVDTNPVGYFKSDTQISKNFHDIYHHLSGSLPLNVVIDNPEEDFFESPEHIRLIADMQTFLDLLPGVDKTISFADYLKLVNYASNRFDPEYYRLPTEQWEARMLINTYKTMLGEDLLSAFMDSSFSKTNILMLTHIASSHEILQIRDRILAHIDQTYPRDLHGDVTGFGMLLSASSHLLTSGQMKSLSITMVLVFCIMFLLFLSAKVGLIAIVPNMFPIIVNFGMMGWLGIELSMATSLIASIAIGLAVDDTIHYLFRFNHEFKKDLDEKRALRATLHHIGRPVIYTTLTIGIGFSVLMFSSFKPTAIFGALMLLTMGAALIGDLILLPSLMIHVELVTLWDLVRIKMGREPAAGIPLFHDLSRTEIHYILMAGALRKIRPGETLFSKGDRSDTMYAVISGEFDVLDVAGEKDTDDAIKTKIGRVVAGDILGEMGLIRDVARSATVVSKTDGELVPINWKVIQRLQWLYPPTAHKLFLNLSSILCERIDGLTCRLTSASLVDDMTTLCNRKGFLNALVDEVERARRYDGCPGLCLLRVDIDPIDGEISPVSFNRLVRRVSDYLLDNIRRSDLLGRIDAHLFAVLMPMADSDNHPLPERLKTAIETDAFAVNGFRPKIKYQFLNIPTQTDIEVNDWLENTVAAIGYTTNLSP